MTASHEFRPDVQGLRAFAMGAVALFHASVPMFGGGYVGVDVFFVISGFLITGLLVREIERSGRIDFAAFYARRIRRLLPAALLVLVATALAAYLLLSPIEQRELVRPLLASAVYSGNFWFALQATDYLGADVHANPVLHMWSLAVEEQFYLVWPLLILLAVRAGAPAGVRRRLAIVMSATAVVSFAACVWLTHISQPWAFFASPVRAWEFAAGGLTYLAAARLAHLRRATRVMLLSLGLGMMLAAVLLYDSATRFPGMAAALPVAGAVLVIAAGTGATGFRSPILDNGVARTLGDWSYSWYLWHWPVLVFPQALLGPLGLAERLFWVFVSLALAAVTYHTVENRVRFNVVLARTPLRGIAMGGALTTLGILGVLGLRASSASALADPAQADLVAARTDMPSIYSDGCHLPFRAVDFPECAYGDPSAARTMVLFGDSHAAQWFPALERIALTRGWRLVSLTKSGCPAVDVSLFNLALGRPYEECDAWRDAVMRRIASERPALVVVANASLYLEDERQQLDIDAWKQGLARTVAGLREADAGVLVLHDTPRPDFDVPACLSRSMWHGAHGGCSFDRQVPDPALLAVEQEIAAADLQVHVADVSRVMCGETRCETVIDGRVAYRDDNHLSTEMSRALAPLIEVHIGALLTRLRFTSTRPLHPDPLSAGLHATRPAKSRVVTGKWGA